MPMTRRELLCFGPVAATVAVLGSETSTVEVTVKAENSAGCGDAIKRVEIPVLDLTSEGGFRCAPTFVDGRVVEVSLVRA